MNESEIVRELSRRTKLPEATAAAVVHAMRDLVSEGAIDGLGFLTSAEPPAAHPEDPGLVDRLIAKAKAHPLGTEFLVSGLLASVAITLGAHAFTVEAARRRLKREQEAAKREQEAKEGKNA